jgi:catechol 2,3-dioxygenase-like lactoylglutathione lyase family enzyme
MFTRIDHVTICVPDLAAGIAQFKKLGFNTFEGGSHPGKGTHNAIAFNADDYVELLSIHDQAEHKKSSSKPGSKNATLGEFIAAGGGIRYVVLQTDDLDAEVAAMRKRGVDVSDPIEGSRRSPTGQEVRWKVATPGPQNALPLVFIQQMTPVEDRRKQVPIAGNHANGVYKLERAYIVTANADADAALYAKVLGMPQPKLHKGTVIMSDMAVFELGPTGLGIATPYAAGPASDALERRGPGPFQALYRTTGMGAAARWMQEQGLPPLVRGVRATGEHAMLATPAEACGAYIGFVGPE